MSLRQAGACWEGSGWCQECGVCLSGECRAGHGQISLYCAESNGKSMAESVVTRGPYIHQRGIVADIYFSAALLYLAEAGWMWPLFILLAGQQPMSIFVFTFAH